MKFVAHILAVAMLSLLLQTFLPWWTMALAAFVTGVFFRQNGFMSFLAGLLGVGLLWFIVAYFEGAGLSEGATVFQGRNTLPFVAASAAIGGLVGGFASMTGGVITYKKKNKY